uniref:Dynactin subunit 6 n=1 Tax=Plectus sambesii TaxID=2011161 RepID=A0A914XCR0_9BILA
MSSSSPQLENKLTIATGAVVCQEALLLGEITIGAGTVIHPKAQILAEAGPIIIGENNLIEENALISNKSSPARTMVIGNSNVFEIASQTYAMSVGDNNVVEVRGRVGEHVEVSSGCVIGVGCSLSTPGLLPERTVIFGEKSARRIACEKPMVQNSQLEYLRKALPSYHYLANKKPQ